MASGMSSSTAHHSGQQCEGSYREDLVGLRPLGRWAAAPRAPRPAPRAPRPALRALRPRLPSLHSRSSAALGTAELRLAGASGSPLREALLL
jgi:hypothetical protein